MKTSLIIIALLVGAAVNLLWTFLRRKKSPPPLPDSKANGRYLPYEMVVNPNPINLYCLGDDSAKKHDCGTPVNDPAKIPDLPKSDYTGICWPKFEHFGIDELTNINNTPSVGGGFDWSTVRGKGEPIAKKPTKSDLPEFRCFTPDEVANPVHPGCTCGCGGSVSLISYKCMKCGLQHNGLGEQSAPPQKVEKLCGNCKTAVPQSELYCCQCMGCPYCFTPLSKDASVCTHCGKALKDEVIHDAVAVEEEPDLSAKNLYRLRGMRQAASRPHADHDFIRNVPDGVTSIRILPAAPNGAFNTHHWFIARRQHYIGGWNTGKGHLTVQCKRRHIAGTTLENEKWHGDCPICDKWKDVWKNIDLAEKDGNYKEASRLKQIATQIKSQPRYYYNVIVNSTADNSYVGKVVPIIYSAGRMVHEQICKLLDKDRCAETDEQSYDLLDLGEEGYSVKIRKESQRGGAFSYPHYHVTPHRYPRAAGTKVEVEAWMANLWDLEMVAMSWDKTTKEMEDTLKEADLDTEYHRAVKEAPKKSQKELDQEAADDDFLKELMSIR